MAFTDGKDGSNGFVKRVASSLSMRNKKNATNTRGGEPKLLPRSKSTGSTNYESMKLPSKKVSDVTIKTRIKSSAGVTPLPRREKIDDLGAGTKKKLGKWRSFDDSDSIWLSSDCASPTSLLEERRLSVLFRFAVDESVLSWLSNLANSSHSLNHQEASSIKEEPLRIPKNTKENAENIQKKASKEDLSTPNVTLLDSSTQSSQGKRVSFSQSSSTELESENSSSLTMSCDVSSDRNVHTATHSIHAKNLDEKSAEIVDSKKTSNVYEPLFWPYEQRFDWTPEDILKHFSMSPRRKKSLNAKVPAGTSPRSMREELLQTRKLDLKDGCKRMLVFNGPVTKAAKIAELKRTISNSSNKKNDSNKNEPIRNCVKRNKSLPSRLRKSSQTCSKVVPIEIAQQVIATEKTKAEITARKPMNRRSKTMLEYDFALLNDFSIEKAVGLGEFNGREGIDSEFNSDTFLLENTL